MQCRFVILFSIALLNKLHFLRFIILHVIYSKYYNIFIIYSQIVAKILLNLRMVIKLGLFYRNRLPSELNKLMATIKFCF